jgi:hypothetical protein
MCGTGGWSAFVSEDCLVFSNAEVFPTVLDGVWNLFNMAGNEDAFVYANAKDSFYRFLLEQGEAIDPDDTPPISVEECTPPPTALVMDQSVAVQQMGLALFLLTVFVSLD